MYSFIRIHERLLFDKKPVNTGIGLSNRIRGFEQGKLNGLKSERSIESGRFRG